MTSQTHAQSSPFGHQAMRLLILIIAAVVPAAAALLLFLQWGPTQAPAPAQSDSPEVVHVAELAPWYHGHLSSWDHVEQLRRQGIPVVIWAWADDAGNHVRVFDSESALNRWLCTQSPSDGCSSEPVQPNNSTSSH